MSSPLEKKGSGKFDGQIQRLAAYLENVGNTDRSIAQALGATDKAFSKWKKNDAIPAIRLENICRRLGLSYDWVARGVGPATTAGRSSLDGDQRPIQDLPESERDMLKALGDNLAARDHIRRLQEQHAKEMAGAAESSAKLVDILAACESRLRQRETEVAALTERVARLESELTRLRADAESHTQQSPSTVDSGVQRAFLGSAAVPGA